MQEDLSREEKPKKIKKAYVLFTAILLIPLWMFLVWCVWPKSKMVASIIDKTVMTTEGQEHVSISWLMNNNKLTKTATKLYKVEHDYFGFFPEEDEKFRLKGLERFSDNQLNKLADISDFVYYTDTYGIYKNEWYTKRKDTIYGKLYGGLSSQDFSFLKKMKERKKLIVTEFNTMASPTRKHIRNKFEKLFGIQWSGWTGRYFNDLDTLTNMELPKWLVRNYKKSHKGEWNFKTSGIAFVSEGGFVEVLEDSLDLNVEIPYIYANKRGREEYGLPKKMKYSFWFDIIKVDPEVNDIVAGYHLDVNKRGAKLLKNIGVPTKFPAVTLHNQKDYRFYYFSGDFCDNPISMTSSYFKGIEAMSFLFYDKADLLERESFFWEFYNPMMNIILEKEEPYLPYN